MLTIRRSLSCESALLLRTHISKSLDASPRECLRSYEPAVSSLNAQIQLRDTIMSPASTPPFQQKYLRNLTKPFTLGYQKRMMNRDDVEIMELDPSISSDEVCFFFPGGGGLVGRVADDDVSFRFRCFCAQLFRLTTSSFRLVASPAGSTRRSTEVPTSRVRTRVR